MTPAEFATPPSELEIAALFVAMKEAGITVKGMNIVRRLAFERDMLRQQLHDPR